MARRLVWPRTLLASRRARHVQIEPTTCLAPGLFTFFLTHVSCPAGYLTAADIATFFTNVWEFGPRGPSAALTKFVQENDAWTRQQASANHTHDDYWLAVQTVLDRFDGMWDGYQLIVGERAPAVGRSPGPRHGGSTRLPSGALAAPAQRGSHVYTVYGFSTARVRWLVVRLKE
jgi:hypothetical protein